MELKNSSRSVTQKGGKRAQLVGVDQVHSGFIQDAPARFVVGNRPEAEEALLPVSAGHEVFEFGQFLRRKLTAPAPLEVF